MSCIADICNKWPVGFPIALWIIYFYCHYMVYYNWIILWYIVYHINEWYFDSHSQCSKFSVHCHSGTRWHHIAHLLLFASLCMCMAIFCWNNCVCHNYPRGAYSAEWYYVYGRISFLISNYAFTILSCSFWSYLYITGPLVHSSSIYVTV